MEIWKYDRDCPPVLRLSTPNVYIIYLYIRRPKNGIDASTVEYEKHSFATKNRSWDNNKQT